MTSSRRLARSAGALAVALVDLAACASLLAPSPRAALPPVVLLAAHAAISLGAGALLAGAAPPFVRHRASEVAVFTACLAFFVPVLGVLGALIVLTRGLTEARPPSREPWLVHDGPADLEERTRREARGLRRRASAEEVGSALRDRSPEAAGARFRAVLATRHLPATIAVPLLRAAQSDPTDEVRLYAFSRLETMRGEIERRIERLARALTVGDRDEEPRLNLRLAESYGELAWSGLAEGAVLDHALRCAHRHAALACELVAGNAAAEFFLGRVLVRLRDPARAEVAFERAIAAGYPRKKALPLLAECAFEQREHEAVGALLAELAASPHASAALRPVIDLWAESEPARSVPPRAPRLAESSS
ncbi:MAG: hypothetical protein KF764_13285 [Labilithrix sp.]|nr:hypothetical protein [Labilithrix sp.]